MVSSQLKLVHKTRWVKRMTLLGWICFSVPIFLLKTTGRAIVLSLQETTPQTHEVIDLAMDDDGDDDARFQAETERAIAASKAEISRSSSWTAANLVARSDPQSTIPGASTFLSERAQLEKERRDRQKRLRPESSLDDNHPSSDSEEDGAIREPSAKRQRLSSLSGVRTNNASTRPTSPSSAKYTSASVQTIDLVFWDGEFRQTATRHAEPRKDGRLTFRITEVLGHVSLW